MMLQIFRAAALGWALTLLASAGCGQAEDDFGAAPTASDWLAEVRSVHLRVDAALAEGRPELASELLRAMLSSSAPASVEPDDRRVVLQDLAFRLADAELRRADGQAALAAADGGLAHGRAAADVFVANLLIVRGAALEALARDTEAAASYYDALQISQRQLAALLAEPDAGRP